MHSHGLYFHSRVLLCDFTTGLAVVLVVGPLNAWLMKNLFRLHRVVVKDTDRRVKITNEVLQGIKIIKLYDWQESFVARLNAIRVKELGNLKIVAFMRAGMRAISASQFRGTPVATKSAAFAKATAWMLTVTESIAKF